MIRAPDRDELREHLLASRIAGDVATSRESNITNLRRMLDRAENYTFGLELRRSWSYDEAVALMAQRVGIDPDADRVQGPDTIDPELTLGALDRMAVRIGEVAAQRGRALVATGHPTGLLVLHQAVARALSAAGGTLLTPADGAPVQAGERRGRILYVDGVAVLATAAHLLHTHDPSPMRAALAELTALHEPLPDLVLADHGWAGAAAQAGVTAVGFADCNDPALFVGEADGVVAVTVPLDDNVAPRLYAPVTAYLLAGAGLTPRD